MNKLLPVILTLTLSLSAPVGGGVLLLSGSVSLVPDAVPSQTEGYDNPWLYEDPRWSFEYPGSPIPPACEQGAPLVDHHFIQPIAVNTKRVDLSPFVENLSRFSDAVVLPWVQEPSFPDAWAHSDHETVAVAFTDFPLENHGAGHWIGWGGCGNAVVKATANCLWGVTLHEVGHAWGMAHSEAGVMKTPVECEEANRGFQ